eukprot:CAMPEP_0119342776 /NCGR_PEP_ID=MMETSP1333-20130426/105411_1 /TAXON_ID=418940 /ORGANISM="Scyphosphaera apsteinii, Strain RCC1455" /LENGTH=223 /DNA_ID=CAMNT_0007355063 /DNA_START=44 /DNA_END=715 /DNA_ORIENTATION=+
MSRVGRMPIKIPESVKVALEPYAPGELHPIKQPSKWRLKRMLKSRPCKESFQAFGSGPSRAIVEGPLGHLRVAVHSICKVEQDGDSLKISSECGGESKLGRTMWGTTRGYIDNAVKGVSQGFRKELELHGVGFRARLETRDDGKVDGLLVLRLGFANEIMFPVPDGVTLTVATATNIVVFGAHKQQVGEVASAIRRFRKPDAYKGKGIRYVGEVLKLKPGKRR